MPKRVISLSELQADTRRRISKETFRWNKESLEMEAKTLARPFVEACDQILQNNPHGTIAAIGTGGRDIHLILRTLARNLPSRGDPDRTKLLDISGDSIRNSNWAARQLNTPHLIDSKILAYISGTGLLKSDKIMLIDTGFRGSIINHLKSAILRKSPEKRVNLMLFGRAVDVKIPLPPGMEYNLGAQIAHMLEYGKGDQISPSTKKAAGFAPRNRHLRPIYRKVSKISVELAKARTQIILAEARKYIREQKAI